jgi:hypothetical protein
MAKPGLSLRRNKQRDAMGRARSVARRATKMSVEDEIAHLRGLDLKGLRARWQSVFRRQLGRQGGIPKDRRSRHAGRDLLEQLQPLNPVALPPGRAYNGDFTLLTVPSGGIGGNGVFACQTTALRPRIEVDRRPMGSRQARPMENRRSRRLPNLPSRVRKNRRRPSRPRPKPNTSFSHAHEFHGDPVADLRKHWSVKEEKEIRNKANLTPEKREELYGELVTVERESGKGSGDECIHLFLSAGHAGEAGSCMRRRLNRCVRVAQNVPVCAKRSRQRSGSCYRQGKQIMSRVSPSNSIIPSVAMEKKSSK